MSISSAAATAGVSSIATSNVRNTDLQRTTQVISMPPSRWRANDFNRMVKRAREYHRIESGQSVGPAPAAAQCADAKRSPFIGLLSRRGIMLVPVRRHSRMTAAPPFVIFPARRVLTMNPASPVAAAVAVRDGRIVGVGDADALARRGPHRIDDRHVDRVLMPGLVEAHSHLLEGGMWDHPYVGFHPRRGADGKRWPALASIDAAIGRMRDAEARMPDPDAPLIAWGFDPILIGGPRMTAVDLDRVSSRRPVAVIHSNFHALNANSAMLARAGITRDTDVDGIVRDAAGQPTGELVEMAAMFPVFRIIGDPFAKGRGERAAWNFARLAQAAGVTTAIDITNDLSDESVDALARVCARDDFPLRLVAALFGNGVDPNAGIERVRSRAARNAERLRFGPVKLITDGSIQAFTARVKLPGYHDGHPNGLWNIAPVQLDALAAAYHDAGIQLHIHVNGDEASEVAIDALQRALSRNPRPDHRHTLQHCQMADAAQLRRVRALGACVNLFSNHIYYWGDVHRDITIGPERAERMNAAATVHALGIPCAMHSDAPITPIAPLFTAWCAVNRLTATGRLLGAAERIGVGDALRAITLGAAYTLRLDEEIGSIEVGKRADFTVLADDPTRVPPQALKDVQVVGTVVGGVAFDAPSANAR
jgi:predicted amidohydrolase YtcJ